MDPHFSASHIREIESSNPEVLRTLLLDDQREPALAAYFGPDTYRELRQLVEAEQIAIGIRRAPPDRARARFLEFLRPRRDGHVILLPGIMGSKLGDATPDGKGLIWIDPVGLLAGEFQYLALGPADEDAPNVKVTPHGPLWVVYALLYFRLAIHFHVAVFDFDWRRPIEQEADRLFRLFTSLHDESKQPVALVAHSMGGLVSRTMLSLHWNDGVRERLRRLVMLGTPNYGAFGVPQALTGDASVLGILAAADLRSEFGDVVRFVNTFSGLYEMMPTPEARNPHFDGQLLYNPAFWKSDVPLDGARLARAERFQRTLGQFHQQLSDADRTKFTLIAGDDEDTVVAIHRRSDGAFEYQASREGDGTVPHVYSHLDGVETYYVRERHATLPLNGQVIQAAIDVIKKGATQHLAKTQARKARRGIRSEPDLRAWEPPPQADWKVRRGLIGEAIDTETLSASILRDFMPQGFLGIEPIARGAPPASIESAPAVEPFSLPKAAEGRPAARRQLRLTLALGSITEANAAALVVGQYPGVPPEGAIAALDAAVNRTISALYAQGSIHGELGTLFFVPALRSKLYASCIVLAGLGPVGQLTEEGLMQVGTQLIEGLDGVGIYDFATVLLGSGQGNLSVRQALIALLAGFYRGLEAYDTENFFREITLVELDPARQAEIQQVIEQDVLPEAEARKVEVTFRQTQLEKPVAPAAAAKELNVLIRSMNGELFYSVIGRAVTPELRSRIDQSMIDRILTRIQDAATGKPSVDPRDFESLCHLLYQELFPPEVQDAIRTESRERHLLLNLDRTSGRYLWELSAMSARGAFLGTTFTLSRRLSAAGQGSIIRWLAGKELPKKLRMLIIADPDGSLPGARQEGAQLRQQLHGIYDVTLRSGPEQCDALKILGEIERGDYDIVHYAGHALFDERVPEESGWVFSDGVLRARQWRRRQNLPALIFSNACESGVLETAQGPQARGRRPMRAGQIRAAGDGRDFGLAESLLLAGLPNYIGTFWVIPDAESVFFAQAFYRSLVSPRPLGEALRAARQATIAQYGIGNLAWASYMLYGDPGFQMIAG